MYLGNIEQALLGSDEKASLSHDAGKSAGLLPSMLFTSSSWRQYNGFWV